MADLTGGRMIGGNALQSAVDKLSSTIDKMSSAYGSAKPAMQNMSSGARAVWTGKANGGNGGVTSKAGGLATTFKALSNYGNGQLEKQLPMDEYVYNASLGMTGNVSTNQAALRRQAFGQNNQNLNALAVNNADAAQMYSQLGQTAGTPMLNQTAAGRTIQQGVNTIGVANPYMTGSQDAAVTSNIYSANTALASAKMGFMPTRQPGTGKPQSLNAIASNITTQSFGGRTPTMKELNATFGEGGKTRLNMQYAGYSQQSINAVANVSRVQAKVQSAGGNAQEAQQLIDQASHGDTRAQKQLQQRYGVARSDAQGLKNLQSARTGRDADTSSSFNKGIQDSTDELQKFSKAFTTFMNQTGLTDLLGTGGAWASQVSSSLSGFSGGVAGAAGMMGGLKAAGGLTGKFGSAANAAKFSNLGAKFAPYTGVAAGTAGKAGVAGLAVAGAYGAYKTFGTKQGRKQTQSRDAKYLQTWGNKDWLSKNGGLAEKWAPGYFSDFYRDTHKIGSGLEEFLSNASGGLSDQVPNEYGGTGSDAPNQQSNTGTGIGGGDSGGAQKALKWAESISKKHLHYVYGGGSGNSWDCSGFMSGIESVIRGQKPHRRWATTAFNQSGNHKGPPGWKYHQKAAFMVGVEGTSGPNAHTAGTLLGHNVESNGSGGPRVDRNGARGYRNPIFHGHWWGFVPSGKGNAGAADPGGNTDQADDEDDTPDTGGGQTGDQYGSSEEASTLMSLLNDGGDGSSPTTDTTKHDDPPTQGSQNTSEGKDLKGADLKNKSQYYAYAKKEMAALGMSVSYNWPSLQKLWQGESNWNPKAENKSSGAYGIPQSLPGSKMASEGKDWKTNASTQIRWGLKYIKGRPDYRNPYNAYKKWLSRSPHWYETGTDNARGSDKRTAKGALKKLKEMPKPAQSAHRIMDKGDLFGKNKKPKVINLDLKDGAININVSGNLASGTDAQNVAKQIADELAKLDLYSKLVGA